MKTSIVLLLVAILFLPSFLFALTTDTIPTSSTTDQQLEVLKQQMVRVLDLMSQLVKALTVMSQYDKANNTNYTSGFLNKPIPYSSDYSSGSGSSGLWGGSGLGSGFSSAQSPVSFGGFLTTALGTISGQFTSLGGLGGSFGAPGAGGLSPAQCIKKSPQGDSWKSEVTAYYGGPYSSEAEAALEGGAKDETGAPLKSLQDYLSGKSLYVSVALDKNLRSQGFAYGKIIRIPYFEQRYNDGCCIPFAVVDNGGAFNGRGKNPPDKIDVAADRAMARSFKQNLDIYNDFCNTSKINTKASPLGGGDSSGFNSGVGQGASAPTKYLYSPDYFSCPNCAPRAAELRAQGYNVVEIKVSANQSEALGVPYYPYVVDQRL